MNNPGKPSKYHLKILYQSPRPPNLLRAQSPAYAKWPNHKSCHLDNKLKIRQLLCIGLIRRPKCPSHWSRFRLQSISWITRYRLKIVFIIKITTAVRAKFRAIFSSWKKKAAKMKITIIDHLAQTLCVKLYQKTF